MTKRPNDIDLADLYVRDELSADDETHFEVRMLESLELQQHVQTALAIKESLRLEVKFEDSSSDTQSCVHQKPDTSWKSMALAASVVLAVVLTVMLVQISIETKQLKRQIAELSKPQTSVLTVPVNIIRSVDSVVELNIELSGQSQAQSSLQFTLVGGDKVTITNCQALPSANGRAAVPLRSEQIPAGLVQLQVSDLAGNILDCSSQVFLATE